MKEVNQYEYQTELEKQILGCLLLNNDLIIKAQEELIPDDFIYNRDVYEAILKEFKNSGVVSYLTLKTKHSTDILKNWKEEAELACFALYFYDLKQSANTINAQNIGSKLVGLKDITQTKNTLLETYEDINNLLFRATKNYKPHISELLGEFEIELENKCNNNKDYYGASTGFVILNNRTNGFVRGEYWVVGGATSVGKSAFATNLALSCAKEDNTVAYFVVEMSRSAMSNRILSIETDIPAGNIIRGWLAPNNKSEVQRAIENISKYKFNIFAGKRFSTDDIFLQCKKLKIQGKLDVVFIDYIQQLGDKWQKGFNRNDRLTEISACLQTMAKELDCCIVALSQLNREGAKANENINTWALRDSGALEMDADVVLLLSRDKKNDPKKLIVDIAKNRSGRLAKVKMDFNEENLKIIEI